MADHPAYASSRTPAQWAGFFGLCLVGNPPRGWAGAHAPAMTMPVTVLEFYHRACRSVITRAFDRIGWLALMEAARTAEDEQAKQGTHWVIQVDKSFGALFADSEQVRLPGPVVSLCTHREPPEHVYSNSSSPAMILPMPGPEIQFGVTVRPRAQDRFTLYLPDGRAAEGQGGFPDMTCPTCGTERGA